MLRLVFKILLGLAVAGGLALLLYWFRSLEGVTVIGVGGYEIVQPTNQFLLLLAGALLLVWLAIFIARRGVGSVFKLFDFFRTRRRDQGLRALSRAVVALAESDGPRALREAQRAERLLDNPDLTRLVNAQAAKLAGDERKAEQYYEAMAQDPDTDFLGILGLMRQALVNKQPERALRLAERAHALRPKEGEVLTVMFDLQRKKGAWEAARGAVDAMVRAQHLTRDIGDRRRAVLYLSDALSLEEAGDIDAAYERAMAAVRLSPGLAPAAAQAARLMAARGEKRAAARLLITAWKAEPHPDLAAAYAALEADERPGARQVRLERLFSANPEAPETKLLRAEVALAAGDLSAARRALGDVTETAPSARAFALLAAVAQGEGADEAAIRGMLSKAAAAPRGAQWVCDNCGGVAQSWSSACQRCGAFDSLAWRQVEGRDGLSNDALFPLIAGGLSTDGDAAPMALNGARPASAVSDGAEPAVLAVTGGGAGTALARREADPKP